MVNGKREDVEAQNDEIGTSLTCSRCCLCLDSLQCMKILVLLKKLEINVKRCKFIEQSCRKKQVCGRLSV